VRESSKNLILNKYLLHKKKKHTRGGGGGGAARGAADDEAGGVVYIARPPKVRYVSSSTFYCLTVDILVYFKLDAESSILEYLPLGTKICNH
jgi:hypothetical protein